ncbi:hypothetical protein AYO38_02505 [bacterium SCGC AG-212-C10]|nr:hypothetical protein AYO38_02505 [bacterium SCGC AG-212-C10]
MVSMPTKEETLLRLFARAKEVNAWWDAHYSELLEQYPEQFVAVRDGVVVATNADLVVLIDTIREMSYSLDDVDIELISAENGNLIL